MTNSVRELSDEEGACGHSRVRPGGEKIRCQRDAAGEFELYLGETVAVREHLCEQCREQLTDSFDRVVRCE